MAQENPESLLSDVVIMTANADKIPVVQNFKNYSGVGIFGLSRRMAGELGLSEEAAREFLFAISRFQSAGKNRGKSPEELIAWLTSSLEKKAPKDWLEKNLAPWEARAGEYEKLFSAIDDDHPLAIARKAQELAYSHQNIFVGARLITDVRPVFDSAAERIHDFVVTHMLSIEYTDGGQNSTTLTLAMDAMDIEMLEFQCSRAATKIQTLKKELHDFNTIVMPDLDESDGNQ